MANISSDVGESVAVRELDDVSNGARKSTTFHPLAVLEYEFLSRDDGLRLPQRGKSSAALLGDIIYVHARDSSLSSDDRILSYSLTERTWDIISTPEEIVDNYELAVCSSSLVLVGGRSKCQEQLPSCKVWVHQGNEWNADVIPNPTNGIVHEVLSVAGNEHLLCIMCQLFKPLNTFLFYYNMNTGQWKTYPSCKGPKVYDGEGVKLAFHDQNLYAMIYSTHKNTTFFKASISLTGVPGGGDILCGEWTPLIIAKDCCIPRNSRLAVFGNKLIFAALNGQKVKLCIPFEDSKGQASIADVDEFDLQFCGPLCGTFGLSDGSLVVIGNIMDTTNNSSSSTVIQFKSKVQPYDCNKHFNIIALKKLERVMNIPLLTVQAVKQKLSEIKTYAGFKVWTHQDVSTSSSFLQYMSSWLSTYESKRCTIEPTWRNFLDALRYVNLTKLATQIEDCLKTAPVTVEAKARETTGIEEIHKLQVQLKSLHKQLPLVVNSEETVIPQEFQRGIDASYKQCFTVAHKIQQEHSVLKDENEKLTEDKSQLIKERDQLREEVVCLRIKSAEKDERPPSKRQCTDEASVISATVSVKPTLKELLRELRAKAADWEDIGIELEVNDGALKQIKTDNPGNSKSCLRELFRKWLSCADPQPKWPDIVEAVEGIGDEELATKIKERYCP